MENKKKEPIKVLTIDFDYIMSPCIKLYNDMAAENNNPTEQWERIERERNINNHIEYDSKALLNIAAIMKNIMNKNKDCKLYKIMNHEDIIKRLDISENSDDTYFIMNIDFHHDIYYRPEDVTSLSYFNDYNCSNWLAYIYYIDKLDGYSWIKAPNSDNVNIELFEEDLREKISILNSYTLNELVSDTLSGDVTFDYIVFCFSPQWVPYRYLHLFDLIYDLIKR